MREGENKFLAMACLLMGVTPGIYGVIAIP
jgi:hypothetical protein